MAAAAAATSAAASAALGGAAVGAGAAATFQYNRENFLTDRTQRRRASVKVLSWRVEQAKLWRQDVRDLISLTEYKMHVYLIVNIFLFGCTIFLYTEGKLPSGTPHWLMVGNIISIGAAFVFLLLSIWLAMHAAVSAQSFEARILTQMVRLPIPTWEELEATRTYGSEFEKVEGRQMFRVPWLMGWQEGLVGKVPATPDPGELGTLASAADPAAATPASSNSPGAAAHSSREHGHVADPWGLERGVTAADMPELGCPMDEEVAKLRHVMLSRQAAVQWQSYDAFSRISMSIGVQQLMQALSYYILGYLLVQVGNKAAAIFGVVIFTMMANTTVSLDMKCPQFPWWKLRLAQMFLSLGPLCSTIAAFCWADFSNSAAEVIVPIAFISHGLYFGLIAAFCGDSIKHHGSDLPVAFHAVLHLDVFDWKDYHCEQADQALSESRNAADVDVHDVAGRPALRAVRYANGLPVATRPQHPCPLDPKDAPCDLRSFEGAPDITISTASRECGDTEFYKPASFLPEEEMVSTGGTSDPSDGRNDPRDTPWRVFCVSMFLCGFVWLGAAVYCIHGANTGWSLDVPVVEIRHPAVEQRRRPGFIGPELSDFGSGPWWRKEMMWAHSKGHINPASVKWEQWAQDAFGTGRAPTDMLSRPSSSFLAVRPAPVAVVPEQIMLSLPWSNMSPTHLTCDASGSHFVIADRISMYSTTIDTDAGVASGHQHRAAFTELDCPAVLGEGLEDVALACRSTAPINGSFCEVLALHRHGRRLAACPLAAGANLSVGKVDEISDKWLEHYNEKHTAQGGRARSRMEKALAISVDQECKSEIGKESCTVLGTTHGRVVQLGSHSSRNELIPTEVLYEDSARTPTAPKNVVVRAFNPQYLGLLERTEDSIRILDLNRGGLPAGTLSLGLSKPVASFCAGGGHVYMLTRGAVPEMWRIAVPKELMRVDA